ncbi:imidazole glycerol phosphate synthase subunit HisH [Cohnella soli]|uniref:Imidazole glycerol phosphate synthase subunit HisH n=1 Tax=Cohnella soli TaxID=425005 RepID=A0ABW0HKH4_9BACL
MKKIMIIDYDAGNLLSVKRALEHCGAEVSVSGDPEKILKADRVLLPGVGAFGSAMSALRERELVPCIRKFAASGKPFLGICLGMQLMFDESEEFGHHEGLGLIPGRIVHIPDTTSAGLGHKIPHVGWNGLKHPEGEEAWSGTAFEKLSSDSHVYFVHSFMACPENEAHILATTSYNGRKVVAAVKDRNLYGCQFHPEKSGPVGIQIIRDFLMI